MSDDSNIRPRWAKELSETQWTRINTLVDEGQPAALIARRVKLDGSKLRSLQLHVRKHGPRRRLTRFAEFKEALLGNVEEFGGSFARALTTIAEMAVSPEVGPALQVRALRAMNQFTYVLNKMMEGDAKDMRDADVRVEVRDKREKLSSDAIEKIKSIYGIGGTGDDHGDPS